jgi:hypothetical protein
MSHGLCLRWESELERLDPFNIICIYLHRGFSDDRAEVGHISFDN